MCHNLIKDLDVGDYIVDYSDTLFKVTRKSIIENGKELVLSLIDVKQSKQWDRGFLVSGKWFASLFENENHPRDIKDIIKSNKE